MSERERERKMSISRRRRQTLKKERERRRRKKKRRSGGGGGGGDVLSRVAARVRDNVKPKRGLSNGLIRSFLSQNCGSDFKGVYSADRIPKRLAAEGTFLLVVNLAKEREADGHFVCIAASRAALLYLDPYGLPCVQRDVLSFLRRCMRPVKFNARPLQRTESNYCGFYAILFALYLDNSSPWRKNRNFALSFHTSDLSKNDKICVGYIKRMLK